MYLTSLLQVSLGNSTEPLVDVPASLVDALRRSGDCPLDVFTTLFKDPGSDQGASVCLLASRHPRWSLIHGVFLFLGSVVDFTIRDPTNCTTGLHRLADGTILPELIDPILIVLFVTTTAEDFQQVSLSCPTLTSVLWHPFTPTCYLARATLVPYHPPL
jgi:hypothetical protein